ncbi:hypothetical protein CLPU_1c00710 [Gottschalkia purinilytica]|uniref:DUF4870 domain-containing protein n=1 Tax=Gottschalkia purinilytica TaxID=1503 RepID=A0A0L0WEN8_GOTPU|nr:DUF4870 domain-containing protein [Gottschalkia purinilytica]KNF09906.1 hypothetical protein CLPU_1c00710 [Gottschalkia purinilytica]
MLTTEQKLLCALCHLGGFIALPIIAPLVVLLVSNDFFVKQQAKEALAFHIGIFVGFAISLILSIILIGIPMMLILSALAVILPIVAVVRVVDGIDYSYPITGRFVR